MEVPARSRARQECVLIFTGARALRQIASHPSVGRRRCSVNYNLAQRVTHVRFVPRLPLLKICFYASIRKPFREHGVHQSGANSARTELIGYSSSTKVTMLIALVAILCNGPLCLEKVVTTSKQPGMTMTACQLSA
jgi:hypothetical protein